MAEKLLNVLKDLILEEKSVFVPIHNWSESCSFKVHEEMDAWEKVMLVKIASIV